MKNLQVVIPMAGKGQRFVDAGYTTPKPLIPVGEKSMIQVVVENLGLRGDYTFIVRPEDYKDTGFISVLRFVSAPLGGKPVILVDKQPTGQAGTTLLALGCMTEEQRRSPIIVANCDQWLDGWHPASFADFIRRDDPDGAILTFNGSNPKWSFAKVEPEGNRVLAVAEKKPISSRATCGIYYFKSGQVLKRAIEEMMRDEANKVNGEWYLCPVYNTLIAGGSRIIEYPVVKMHGVGVPEDLDAFLGLLGTGKVRV